ncbi:MAG: ribonuclease P protein component [Flavobacteriaceae bacterium]|nr:ribonuclease P protein component [Flavobacteriaceae bacterium]
MSRLKGRQTIKLLFSNGQRIQTDDLQLIYKKEPQSEIIRFAVGVGKKEFRSSVLRNRIKRRLREAFQNVYRCHSMTIEPGDYFLLYQSSELPTYQSLKTELWHLLKKIDY